MLRSFAAGNTDHKVIIKQYYLLYTYRIIRLMLIAMLLTYFVGTIFYFISAEFNTLEDKTSGNYFNKHFNMDAKSHDNLRLLSVINFAL